LAHRNIGVGRTTEEDQRQNRHRPTLSHAHFIVFPALFHFVRHLPENLAMTINRGDGYANALYGVHLCG
jgi:hypothetical protein